MTLPPYRSPWERVVATAAVLFGLVVAAFEGTVVTSAMPTIARDLHAIDAYAWVFSGFLIASTAGVLACGKLDDTFGRRPVFVAGMAVFLAGSALCGAATSMPELIAYRVVQGLGAGAIQPIAMTISADLYTLEERAKIQGVFTSAWGIANVIGPVIGGFLVVHASWRWVFLVNVPPGLLAVGLLLVSYRDPPRVPRAAGDRGPRGLRLFNFSARVVRAGLVGGVFTGAVLYLCAAYVPLWMTTHARLDAVGSGGALVPLLGGWAVGSSFGVKVLVRRGMRTSTAGGFAIASAGAVGLTAVVACGLPIAWAYASLAFLGVGLGPAASTTLVASQSAVPWRSRGGVTSAIYAARTLGGAVAVALFGAHEVAGAGRFAGIAALTVAAAATMAILAPRGVEALSAKENSARALEAARADESLA